MRRKNIILIRIFDLLAAGFIISISLSSLTGINFFPDIILINGAQLFIIYITIRAITYAVSFTKREEKIDEIIHMIKENEKEQKD